MKKILYTDFDSVGAVVDTVIKNSDLRYGLKKAALEKFWSKIVGKKFANYSKPDSLSKNKVLFVACANSNVTNELLMFKNDILKKIEPYSKSLDLEVEDIVFSHKIWKKETDEYEEHSQADELKAADINYDEIELDEEEILNIQKCVENNNFASKEQRQRMFEAIVKDLKYQKFVNSKR